MNVDAMAQAQALQEAATASGYTMALKWCLRCHVGWAGLGNVVCWLCEKDDEVYRWTFNPGGPRMERVTA